MHLYENEIQNKRNEIIRGLAVGKSKTSVAKSVADDLFSLDLTVYSKNYSFESLMYNALATSELDEGISLHPEQLRIINSINSEDALIISAPTSFGKTFCVFEYIARNRPQNVVLIVPTLALVDEYYKKIIKRYRNAFREYRVYTNINEEKEYDFSKSNIFILTHDRVVQESIFSKLKNIDFLVIDEVYKLENDQLDDRVLVLNMAYYYLSKMAKKYVLLAPFIKEIINYEELEKKPVFFRSDYSPVVNEVETLDIIHEDDRFAECAALVDSLETQKTLIYFPTVTGKYGMYKYIDDVVSNQPPMDVIPDNINMFIKWAKEEIHEEWCVVKALERGYLIHNGQIPVGTRIFQLDQYDQSDGYTKMLCTSTLLEGVNTTAENIIIVKPSRKSNKPGECFGAFDFFNLVGRTGRLNEHLIGNAYYIKGPNDVSYEFNDAVKSIRFEILDSSNDMDIQFGNIENNQEVLRFFRLLGITLEEYRERIGTRARFGTVQKLYNRFLENYQDLESVLTQMAANDTIGRYGLIKVLYVICEGKEDKLDISLITGLIDRRRPQIKKVVNSTQSYFINRSIDEIISKAIKLKNGYIEHTFFNRVNIIKFFCEINNFSKEQLDVFDVKILSAIEYLYYMNIKNKKMLLDLGIYERDIDTIIKVIGDDFEDAVELKDRLVNNQHRFKGISYVSTYVIKGLS